MKQRRQNDLQDGASLGAFYVLAVIVTGLAIAIEQIF